MIYLQLLAVPFIYYIFL